MPAEDPNKMRFEATPDQGEDPAEGDEQTRNQGLMGAEEAIEDDLGGSGEPTEKQKETLERKVEEAKQRGGS